MRQLSAQDASFLYLETPTTPSVGSSLVIYDPSTAPGGTVRFKEILAAYESRLHLAKYLRSKIVRVPMDLDHPYWVDDADFDIEFHIRHLALPKPGNWRQLCIQVARLAARPLDLSRPPWELYVIEGLDNVDGLPEGSFALLTKTHHAAIDGVSGTELSNAMHDLSPEIEPTDEAEDDWSPEPEPTPWELVGRAQMNQALLPMRIAESMQHSMPTFPGFPPFPPFPSFQPFQPFQTLPSDLPVAAPRAPVPQTRFNGALSAHRVVEGIRIPLASLKQAKEAVSGATVNDALLTVVGGAIRRYLDAKGELPADPLVAMSPVSIRTTDLEQAGNEVAAMFVPIGTHIKDAIDRLAVIHEETSTQKVMLQAIDARQLTAYSQYLPGALIGASQRLTAELGSQNTGQPVYNTVLTNLPGSQVPLYFHGSKLVEMWGFGIPTPNAGLFHAAQSYCGNVYLGMISCPKMVPDPEFYAECLQASYDDLVRATGPASKATHARSVPRAPAKGAAKKAGAAKRVATKSATTKTSTTKTGTTKPGTTKPAAATSTV